MEHSFTPIIKDILSQMYGENGTEIYAKNLLIQYINEKTRSASKGSKSRSGFANLYAIYVIVEDYIARDFDTNFMYRNYEGAQFSRLFQRQRELPFGSKLQNHALNNRMNAEFQKFFPTSDITPILRDLETNRYWINENLLIVEVNGSQYNVAKAIIAIIDEYVKIKQDSFQRFIKQCEDLQAIEDNDSVNVHEFIVGLLAPNVDARLFEIVSYAILKYYYKEQTVIWGYSWENLNEEALKLYKTGRTNANDGGIDFVMKPLGRFFQVTETLDFKKYFLDIEKIEKYPITFVVKSTEGIEELRKKLYQDAIKTYIIEDIVKKYISCIEDIINIPLLLSYFQTVEAAGMLSDVLNEILLQSKVEFNYEED
ncbi:restriction endonuclease [Bacteroides pyogenes]|uniref:restriction endonuclease n=1 Tax=Bacteroides pyogenes TaxID=310300 RepID=UPI003B431DD2